MEEELQCPVCLRLFEDPLILPCSHTVCCKCVDILISKNANPNSSSGYNSLDQLSRKPVPESDKMSLISDAVLSDSDSGYSGASANGISNERNGSPIMNSSYSAFLHSFQIPFIGSKPPSNNFPSNGVNLPVLPESVKCVTCPICHRTLFLDERGASGLSKNTLMQNIVDRYKKNKANKNSAIEGVKSDSTPSNINQSVIAPVSRPSQHAVPLLSNAGGPEATELCQLCEKTPADLAVVKCLQCDVFYCDLCKENFHPSRGPLAKHNLVSLKRNSIPLQLGMDKPPLYRHNKFPPLPNKPSTKNGLKLASCSQHPSEKTSLYCETCRVSLCVQCQDEGRHKTHSLKPIGSLFRQLKSDLSGQMSALSNKARQAKDLVMLLRGIQEDIEKQSANLEEKTIAQCDHLIETVERKRDELIQKISREKELKSKTARDQLQQCTLKLKQTTGLLEYCIEVVKDNDVAAFLQISQSLAERVVCMEKQWNPRFLSPRVSCQFDLELESSSLAVAIDKLDFIQTKVPEKPLIKVEHNGSNKSNTSVTLTWNMPPKSQPPYGFKLEMDNGCNGPFREIYCGPETTCAVDGLHLNSVYKARVRAFNTAGHGPFSDLLHLQTSEATSFQMSSDQSHSDIKLTDGNTVTCRNSEHRVALGNTGFSRGIHYWEFSIDHCSKRPGPAFGVALNDVDRKKMLGKDCCGCSLYGPDEEQSWLYSDGQHLKRCDYGLKTGARIGLLLDINRQCISFFVDGQLLNSTLFLNSKHTETSEQRIFYPAVSLNEHTQVTLHTNVRAPLSTLFHRNRTFSASSGERNTTPLPSPRLKSFCSNGEARTTPRGTPPPPPVRRSSSGSMRSAEDDSASVSTNGSEPPATRRTFTSLFQRKMQSQANEQRVAS